MNINQAQNQPDSAQKQEFQGSSPYPSPPYGQPPALNQGAPGYQQPNQGYQQPNQGYQAAPTQQQQQQQPQQNAQFNPILQQHQLLIQSIMAQNNGQIPPQYAQLIEMTQMMIQAINQQPAPVQAQTQPPYQPAQSQSQYQSPYQQPQVQQQPIYQPPASAQVFNSQQPAPAQVQAQPPYQPAQSQSSLYQQSAPAQAPYQQATQAPYQQPVPQQPMYQQPAQAFNQQPYQQQPYQQTQAPQFNPLQQNRYPSVPQLSVPLSYYGQTSANSSQILTENPPSNTGTNAMYQSEVNNIIRAWRDLIMNPNSTEQELIPLVAGRDPQQLKLINYSYKVAFNRNMWSEVESRQYFKNFSRLMVAILRPEINFDVNEIHEALRSKSSDNYVAVIDILTGKTNDQIIGLKNRYKEVYQIPLVGDVDQVVSGRNRLFIFTLLQANRDENDKKPRNVGGDVTKLFESADSWLLETCDNFFIKFFTDNSYLHIARVAEAFGKKYGQSLEEFIRLNADAELEYALVSLLKFAFSPPEYAAHSIYRSLNNEMGVDDAKLIRTVIRFFHHNADPGFRALVAESYFRIAQRSLQDSVGTSNIVAYQTLLLTILGPK